MSLLLSVGEFQAYDQHLNMMLGDVEETATKVEIDHETQEQLVKARFLRSITSIGDSLPHSFFAPLLADSATEYGPLVCTWRWYRAHLTP
jgi:hypothetical protein